MHEENEADSHPEFHSLRLEPPKLIRLVLDGSGRFLVTPSDPSEQTPSFETFIFPGLPLSMNCWLAGLGSEFRRRHDRCLAALLTVDCRAQRWIAPIIPSQTCSQDGSTWTLDVGRPLPGHHRIAGSFQMRVVSGVMEAVETVPSFDGLHIVQSLVGQRAMAYCFLHFAGETGVVTPEQAMQDDWGLALAEAASRMSLE